MGFGSSGAHELQTIIMSMAPWGVVALAAAPLLWPRSEDAPQMRRRRARGLLALPVVMIASSIVYGPGFVGAVAGASEPGAVEPLGSWVRLFHAPLGTLWGTVASGVMVTAALVLARFASRNQRYGLVTGAALLALAPLAIIPPPIQLGAPLAALAGILDVVIPDGLGLWGVLGLAVASALFIARIEDWRGDRTSPGHVAMVAICALILVGGLGFVRFEHHVGDVSAVMTVHDRQGAGAILHVHDYHQAMGDEDRPGSKTITSEVFTVDERSLKTPWLYEALGVEPAGALPVAAPLGQDERAHRVESEIEF